MNTPLKQPHRERNTGTVLACVSSSPFSGDVVRRAGELADQMGCDWRAIHVETPLSRDRPDLEKERALENLRLAENLGATTSVIQAQSVAPALVDEAKSVDDAILVIGKPDHSTWWDLFGRSTVDRMTRSSGSIDVFVVRGEPSESDSSRQRETTTEHGLSVQKILASSAVVGICTAVGLGIRSWVANADILMVFLLGVMFVAYRMERIPALSAALLSVAAFDFFFVVPYHTLAVDNLRHLLTFAVMAAAGLTISELTARVKGQARAAQRREEGTAALYTLTQKLALETEDADLLRAAATHLHDFFGADVAMYRRTPDGSLTTAVTIGESFESEAEWPAIEAALENGDGAGAGTREFPGAKGFYLPVTGVSERFGAIGIVPEHQLEFADPEVQYLLKAHADQIGLFLERLRLSREARETKLELETEKVRNAVLSSVSHDLRTPVGSIMGSASALVDSDEHLSRSDRVDLAEAIFDESRRLDRLLENLLKMTQIEGEQLDVEAEWHVPSEVVRTALSQLDPELRDREIDVALPEQKRLAQFDGPLIQQVLVNLLENAYQYSPGGSPITISGQFESDALEFRVADRGPGIPEEERGRVFDKFYQGTTGDEPGSGLGLTICRAIVEAHGGEIEILDNPDGGGAVFAFRLPQPERRSFDSVALGELESSERRSSEP